MPEEQGQTPATEKGKAATDNTKGSESIWNWLLKPSTLFFIITFVCIAIINITFSCKDSRFEKSHKKIVKNQMAQIDSVKSVLKTIHNNAQNAFSINEAKIQKLISDSILTKIPNLNDTQQAVLNKYIKAVIIASTSELAYKDWTKELNIVLGQKEMSQIQQESKTLLELEFSKIQSEYEAMELWAAILTIVFLIFSFYSLFKTDDMVKQGKEGLKEIGDIKKESQDTIQKTEEAHSNLQTKIYDSERELLRINQSRIASEKEISQLNEKIESANTLLRENVNLQEQLDILIESLSKTEERMDLLNEDLFEKETKIDELNRKMPNAIIFQNDELDGDNIQAINGEEEEEDDDEPQESEK